MHTNHPHRVPGWAVVRPQALCDRLCPRNVALSHERGPSRVGAYTSDSNAATLHGCILSIKNEKNPFLCLGPAAGCSSSQTGSARSPHEHLLDVARLAGLTSGLCASVLPGQHPPPTHLMRVPAVSRAQGPLLQPGNAMGTGVSPFYLKNSV